MDKYNLRTVLMQLQRTAFLNKKRTWYGKKEPLITMEINGSKREEERCVL